MKRYALATLLCAMLTGCIRDGPRAPAGHTPLSLLRADGLQIVNETGKPVALRGYNLGSWLLLEPWMVCLNDQSGIQAEKDIWDQLDQRFGAEKMRACVAAHRENFITEADLDRLHELGVNFIRLPIWWRVTGDARYDADGIRYVDRLLDWCEARGIYVLLDLHGGPGGQNTGANILGERPDGTYWRPDSPHRAETVAWWRKIAERYRDRSVVAGYDLLNEAWAAPSVKQLVAHMDEIYRAIREVDPRHILFIEDALQGYYRLPRPSEAGWTNVVYSFHFYPEDGARFAERDVASIAAAQRLYGVPVHIGEFNVYADSRGGVPALEACLAAFNARGWAWNLWSFKKLEQNREYFWGLTGYTDRALPGISLATSSFDEILSFFRGGASPHWREHDAVRAAVERQLRAAVTAPASSAPGGIEITEGEIELTPAGIAGFQRAGHICVEWQNSPPNIGYWNDGDAVVFRFDLPGARTVTPSFWWSSPNERVRVRVEINGAEAGRFDLAGTGDWHRYEWQRAAQSITLPAGRVELKLTAIEVTNESGAGNLRALKLSSE